MTELQYSSICHIAQILCLVRTLSSASLTGRSSTTAILVAERRFILAWIVGCWNILATIGNEGSCLQYLFLLPNILQSWPSSPNILWTRLLWHLRTKNTWRKSHLLLCAEYYWNIICVQILCNRRFADRFAVSCAHSKRRLRFWYRPLQGVTKLDLIASTSFVNSNFIWSFPSIIFAQKCCTSLRLDRFLQLNTLGTEDNSFARQSLRK